MTPATAPPVSFPSRGGAGGATAREHDRDPLSSLKRGEWDFWSEADTAPDFVDRLRNGPPSSRVEALLKAIAGERRRLAAPAVSSATKATAQRVWRQLEDDARLNGDVTTTVRSSGPDATKALRRLREELSPVLDLPGPKPPRGRPRDRHAAAVKTLDARAGRFVGDVVLMLLEARAEARRQGFNRRNREAFDAATRKALVKRIPPEGWELGWEVDRDRTKNIATPPRRIVLPPEKAAANIVRNYSHLADELGSPRAVNARFGLDHRTSQDRRRKRRTSETHS